MVRGLRCTENDEDHKPLTAAATNQCPDAIGVQYDDVPSPLMNREEEASRASLLVGLACLTSFWSLLCNCVNEITAPRLSLFSFHILFPLRSTYSHLLSVIHGTI